MQVEPQERRAGLEETGGELGLNHPRRGGMAPAEAGAEVLGYTVLMTGGNGGAVKPGKMLREKLVPSLTTPSKAEWMGELVCALTMAYDMTGTASGNCCP